MGRTSNAKQRLLEAAIELMWQGSYGAVTVDGICDRAGVKKGSFYHFFQTKTDLVLAALEWHFQAFKPELDRIFSPSVPPLQRLRDYFEMVYAGQCELKKKTGVVPGCPYGSVGSETSCSDKVVCQKIQEILKSISRYFESALRDAQAEGLIEVRDVPSQARAVLAYYGGALTQARIQNDPELTRHVFDGVLKMVAPAGAVA